jgi:hypothetical protein
LLASNPSLGVDTAGGGQVDSIKTREDLMDMLVYLMNWNIPTFFSINVAVGVRACALVYEEIRSIML